MPESALPEVFCEHHEDAARAAQVRELVEIPVCRDGTQGVAAVPSGGRESRLDVIDRERNAMHPDLVGLRRFGVDCRRVDVFEEFKLSVALGCLQQRDLHMIAIESDRCVRPLPAHLVSTHERQTEICEERDRPSRSRTAIPTFTIEMLMRRILKSTQRTSCVLGGDPLPCAHCPFTDSYASSTR